MLLIQTSHCSIGTAVGYVIHMYVNYQRNLLIRLSGYTKCHRDVCSIVDFVPSSLLNKNNHNKTLEGESKKKKKRLYHVNWNWISFCLFVCILLLPQHFWWEQGLFLCRNSLFSQTAGLSTYKFFTIPVCQVFLNDKLSRKMRLTKTNYIC